MSLSLGQYIFDSANIRNNYVSKQEVVLVLVLTEKVRGDVGVAALKDELVRIFTDRPADCCLRFIGVVVSHD